MNDQIAPKFAVALLAISIAACGGGSKGPAKLTPAQKQTVKTTLSSTTVAARATTNASRAKKGTATFSEPNYAVMEDYIANNMNDCIVQESLPVNTSSADEIISRIQSGERIGLNISASGNCPLSATFGVSVKQPNEQSATIKIDLSYKVLDSVLAGMNDVNEFSMDSTVSARQSGNGASIDMNLNGRIKSKSEGVVTISGSGNVQASEANVKGDITVDFVFEDFTAQFKLVGEGDNAKLTLNGEEIPMDELNDSTFASFMSVRESHKFMKLVK